MATGDTLLTVMDTSDYILIIPARWKEKMYVKENQSIYFNGVGLKESAEAKIYYVGHDVKPLNGEQVFVSSAIVLDDNLNLAPGLMVSCTIGDWSV